jgi:hypothetical protein
VAVAPVVGAWTPRAHGAREGRVRGFWGGALRCLAVIEAPPKKKKKKSFKKSRQQWHMIGGGKEGSNPPITDEGIDSWLVKFKLKEEDRTQVQQELEKYVESVEGFEDLEQEDIGALEVFIAAIDGLVISKKNKLKKAIRSAWKPDNEPASVPAPAPSIEGKEEEGDDQDVAPAESLGDQGVSFSLRVLDAKNENVSNSHLFSA